jgi:hypothetical protein
MYKQRLVVQVDLAPRETIRALPERVFADTCAGACSGGRGRFGDLLSPLVIEASGEVVPLMYGFDRSLSLGNLRAAEIGALAEGWLTAKHDRFRALCRRVYERIVGDDERTIVNWYEEVSAEARRAA